MSADSTLFFDVQQKTDKQHILDNPDTYIGSVENIDSTMWIMNSTGDKIIESDINYIPGLYKIFDEGIVNCRDHAIRMKKKVDDKVENAVPVSYIDISIDETTGTIAMTNDGNGMDVAEKDGFWIPELVFGHLRTSTNYNKDEKKIVGGKNGFGFKLVLIWSTYGRIETVDHIRGLKYVQEYKHNLDEICPPTITKCKSKPYTKITFTPDFVRLGIRGLSSDIVSLFKKRVYDISAITDKTLKVKYNGELIPIKNFEQYVNLYIGDKSVPRVYECNGERWEYVVAMTPNDAFSQISFVNGIHTSKGGKHVEYILNQILRQLCDFIEKKKKIKVSPNTIKEQLILFLRCDIENPAFDSQTKDFMNTPASKFGSKCDVSDKFIEKVAKLGIMDAAIELTNVKEKKAAKKEDGEKTKKIYGITKLEDANWAGTNKSHLCELIVCEGDSAKAGIISGLSAEDRNIYGVYPLKGKPPNIRNKQLKDILKNEQIDDIKKICGLELGKKYTSMEEVHKHLRYSKISIMTDQDKDGTHIKGLIINVFDCDWPELLRLNGFINYMNTPILIASRNKQKIEFYNESEYNKWKMEESHAKSWTIKYYKGLGTSTSKEFKSYFANKKSVMLEFTENTSDLLDMVFKKERADDRKHWLQNVYDVNSYINTNSETITYDDFINKELIHFSKYDCDRNIPNLIDGQKISQRKALFGAFKRNLIHEIKVSQFSGYISENACYHHGEASLNATIIGMAQNYVGSNNINLLMPNGQFGTRLMGGEDSASERYIFTCLNKITRTIFQPNDDHVLTYLDDDGTMVEPRFYVPIIPMILVNGTIGIGTGFSSSIPCYDPLQIIQYIRNKLQNIEEDIDFIPYYNGFTGKISKINDGKFLIKASYEKINEDTIRIQELPIGVWSADYKAFLEVCETLKEDKKGNKLVPFVKNSVIVSTDHLVDITITFVKDKLAEFEAMKGEYGCNGLEKIMKLYTTTSTTNMHLFNHEEKLVKFETVPEIIDAFYEVRLEYYKTRREYMINELTKETHILSNKVRYVQECINDTISFHKKTNAEIITMLTEKNYALPDDPHCDYLTHMKMISMTVDNVSKLTKTYDDTRNELECLIGMTPHRIWLNELTQLEEEYVKYKFERIEEMNGGGGEEASLPSQKPPKKVVKKVEPKETKKPKTKKTDASK
jgi:DNA topoisomerase-2